MFAGSLKDNISTKIDVNDAYDWACKVGLKEKIDMLPDGIQTLYMKSYDVDGIDLSGGEKQKLALARALSKNANLVILDGNCSPQKACA